MFHGSIVALVTPFKKDGSIDFEAVQRLLDFHLLNGTDAIVLCGSTGEAATLLEEEQEDLIRFVLKHVKGKIPIIAGTGTNCTATAIKRTKKAMELGVDGCLIVSPYYTKPTQHGLIEHYQAIANAVPIPIILYNIPGRTGSDMLPETVLQLAKIPNIIGIKESSPQILERTAYYHAECLDRFDIYSGDDKTALAAMKLGAKGVISVVANIAPKQMKSLCHLVHNHRLDEAEQIDKKLQALYDDLFVESNPIPVKWAIHQLGLAEPFMRLPLTLLSTQQHDKVKNAMLLAGLIN